MCGICPDDILRGLIGGLAGWVCKLGGIQCEVADRGNVVHCGDCIDERAVCRDEQQVPVHCQNFCAGLCHQRASESEIGSALDAHAIDVQLTIALQVRPELELRLICDYRVDKGVLTDAIRNCRVHPHFERIVGDVIENFRALGSQCFLPRFVDRTRELDDEVLLTPLGGELTLPGNENAALQMDGRI